MSEVNIFSKKVEYAETGVWGPSIIEAEIGIKEDDGRRYLRCEWCGEAEYSVLFELTTESLFDNLINMGDIDELEKIQKESIEKFGNIDVTSVYAAECCELMQMIEKLIRQSGIYEPDEVDDFVSDWRAE